MSERTITLNSPLIRGLASAALTNGLRRVLLFDMSAHALQSAANIWAEMLQIATNEPVVRVTLAPTVKEDDIWGQIALPTGQETLSFVFQAGLLMPPEQDGGWLLVCLPDLTKLSLPAARACVMLMGASVAHLERHGQTRTWQPKICWLASCATEEVGKLSPHLLDRFTLRLPAPAEESSNRLQALLSRMMAQENSKHDQGSLPESIKNRLERASKSWPEISEEAFDEVLSYLATVSPSSPPTLEEKQEQHTRRRIAFSRLAVAQARLAGDRQVTAKHVDMAAQLIALETQIDELPKRKPLEELPRNEELKEQLSDLSAQPSAPGTTTGNQIYESDSTQSFDATSLPADYSPYPEDTAMVEREAASLRLPFRHDQGSNSNRGPIIGVQRATALRDIAIVQTLLSAAKFQPIRQKQHTTPQKHLYLSPSDLHSYRRSLIPRQMLVLLLDYTSLADCDWQSTIISYLQWSYVQRASICLIQVGAKNAPHELQAQRIVAHSILNPHISRALETAAGRATPLAHGLELARQTIRHALQHGRSRIDSALLLVLSDGRGNVPLKASQTNQLTMPVKRLGIEDALQIAHKINRLPNVETIVLNPQPRQYTDLPHELARALGAKIADLPRPVTTEAQHVE